MYRFSKWGSSVLFFGRCTRYCFQLCPGATLISVILYALFKSSVLIAMWAQAEAVAWLTDSDGESSAAFIALIATFCLFSALYRFRGYITIPVNTIIGNTVTLVCKKRIMRACASLPLQQLDTEETNTHIKRATDKAEDLQGDVMMFADAVSGVFSLGVFIIAILSYKMGLVYLAAVVLMAFGKKLFSILFTEKDTELRLQQTNARRKCDYYFNLQTDRASTMELKMDGLYGFFTHKWRVLNDQIIADRVKLNGWGVLRNMIMGAVSELISVLTLLMLAYQVTFQHMPIRDYMYLVGAIASSVVLLETLIRSFEIAYKEGAHFEPLQTIMDIDKSQKEDSKSFTHASVRPMREDQVLSMQGVSFSYNGRDEVLTEVDFQLKKREIVALVGPNGGGKSTLVKVALSLLKPTSGTVFLLNENIQNMTSDERCRAQGVIFQDFVKYKTTLRDSVGFGDTVSMDDDEAIFRAMKLGGSERLLARVQGLDVYLGRDLDETGFELSVGEWQRIAVSRAFMGDHVVMIFDEPSSAIDPFSELRQFEHIKAYLTDKAGILVTHRVGLCKLADRIVYLDRGRIIEQGTHESLLALEGQYAQMYHEQSKWYKRGDNQ